MRLASIFSFFLTFIFAQTEAAEPAPKGLERIAASMFVAQCINNRELWFDHANLYQRFRSRNDGQTKSISDLPIFNDTTIEEYILDGRVTVSALGAGYQGRAEILGGVRANDSQKYCFISSEGARREKIIAALENEGARSKAGVADAEETARFCFNGLRRSQVAHEIYIFIHVGDDEHSASRGEILIRYDVEPGATSCTDGG